MICKPELSQKAAKIYEENRYPAHGVCPRSCKKMKISTVYLARYVNEDKTASHVTFNFGKLIEVSVEVESYRFLNMVAEIGGKKEIISRKLHGKCILMYKVSFAFTCKPF